MKKEYEIAVTSGDSDSKLITFPGLGDTWGPANPNAGYAVMEEFQRLSLFAPLFGAQGCTPVLLSDMQGAPNFRHRVTLKGMYRALICTFCLYVLVGVSGTASFGHDMAGNILLGYLPSNWLMTTVRLLYTFNMLLSFVIVIYPVRAAILEWFHVSQNTSRGRRWFYVVGTIVPLAAVGLSIAVPNIVMVINIISSVFGFATYWLIPLVCIYICPRLKAKSLVPISDEVQGSDDLNGQSNAVVPENPP